MKRTFFLVFFLVSIRLSGVGAAQSDSEKRVSPLSTGEPAAFSVTSPAAAIPEEISLFKQAKNAFSQRNDEGAVALLEEFLFKYPDSALLPDVYLQFGEIYVRKGEFRKGVEVFKTILEKFPDFDGLDEVRLKLSDAYLALEELEAVLSFWKDVPGKESSKIAVYDQVARAYSDKKDYYNTLQVLLKKKELLIDPIVNDAVREAIVSIVQEKFSEKDLQALTKQFPETFPGEEALIRLIGYYDKKGDYYREEREVKRFAASFQSHPFAADAQDLLGALKDKIKTSRYLVAVLLPLSGKLAPFGASALNGAQLALQQFKETLPGASVGLVVKDIEDEIFRSRNGLEGWLSEYRPVAMVGPLLSKEVDRVAPTLEKWDLSLITPGATSPRLASLGRSVFRNAVTTRVQCQAIAELAVSQLNLKRIAILFPKESYGMEWVKCFSEEATKLGGEIVHAEPYPLNETDFTHSIRRLKEADLKKNGVIEVIETEKGKKEISYIPGFDAIFLPGEAQKVGLLIPQLAFHDIKGVTFLGASGWNGPDFLKIAGSYAEGAVFVDGFFQGSADPLVRKFVGQYRAKYQQEPDLFAAQAFDATRMILASLEKGATTSQEVTDAIINTKNFPGVSGLVLEVREGEIVKKPLFIQVQKGRFALMNPAPAPQPVNQPIKP